MFGSNPNSQVFNHDAEGSRHGCRLEQETPSPGRLRRDSQTLRPIDRAYRTAASQAGVHAVISNDELAGELESLLHGFSPERFRV